MEPEEVLKETARSSMRRSGEDIREEVISYQFSVLGADVF
jgi:hypothetical protein